MKRKGKKIRSGKQKLDSLTIFIYALNGLVKKSTFIQSNCKQQ